jgi:hypothetical protein
LPLGQVQRNDRYRRRVGVDIGLYGGPRTPTRQQGQQR